jgi:hypothetical protein
MSKVFFVHRVEFQWFIDGKISFFPILHAQKKIKAENREITRKTSSFDILWVGHIRLMGF